MKQYITLLSIILIITSCDVEEKPFINDYDAYINPEKKVLIEDFTGHKCANCPGAARELDEISATYPGQIIGIAIHAGSFAKPDFGTTTEDPYSYDFRTNAGDIIDNSFGNLSASLPSGMINRTGYPDNHNLGSGEWLAVVANELKKEIAFTIDISSDESSISIASVVQKNITGNYNLVVCLTESNIINWQQDMDDPNLDVEDYEHNHVLRAELIDQALSTSTNYVAGLELENIINYDLVDLEQSNIEYSNADLFGNGEAGKWNANNISVVAYIYNTITKEIVQVEESHLNK